MTIGDLLRCEAALVKEVRELIRQALHVIGPRGMRDLMIYRARVYGDPLRSVRAEVGRMRSQDDRADTLSRIEAPERRLS